MLRIAIVSVVTCFVSSAALSAETWDCAFHVVDGPPGLSGQATMEIDGNELKWMLPAHPMPSVNGYVGETTVEFTVLENNNVGLVAVLPRARMDKDVGQIISAVVIVLNKSDGVLREGSVSMHGLSDTLKGLCRHK